MKETDNEIYNWRQNNNQVEKKTTKCLLSSFVFKSLSRLVTSCNERGGTHNGTSQERHLRHQQGFVANFPKVFSFSQTSSHSNVTIVYGVPIGQTFESPKNRNKNRKLKIESEKAEKSEKIYSQYRQHYHFPLFQFPYQSLAEIFTLRSLLYPNILFKYYRVGYYQKIIRKLYKYIYKISLCLGYALWIN